ncbi:FYVE zinc finger-domain-containing protein [Neohortaea acidophila]|uniref:RING-type E3 ubiquitin transferase n=1 Tax=Neohortaea acidophila TaxID=245834 RepID=A0A6A6PNE8_9PEZI|nr:FYVE zinc finger-domain-containing protein [Neohortaea acidophila]KAF2481164.1 FYVE zinc finger-domain-containing protein [Neohortaea acidophila]
MAGQSRETAIDLTSPTRPPPPRSSSRRRDSEETIRAAAHNHPRPGMGASRPSGATRQSSDVVLPPWQPDAAVDRCPVCGTDFSFWYRKHHCRKCGRVVCAGCSPHRITIPRQYVVQPPALPDADRWPLGPPIGNPYRTLEGGEVVRVCNPCVPDPWTPGAEPDGPAQPTDVPPRRRDSHEPARYRYQQFPPPPSLQRPQPPVTSNPPGGLSQSLPPNNPAGPNSRAPPPPPPDHTRPSTHRYTASASTAIPPTTQPQPARQRPPAGTTSTTNLQPQPRPPRREIPEEDECPVCGLELPPGDAVREAHIQECITARFSSNPSNTTSVGSAPHLHPPRTSSTQSAPTATDAPPTAPSTSAPSNTTTTRPRATSYRPRGMAVYRATEKDCADAAGEPQECVICFEEFQPGEEMGRMECLCKFHRTCIRAWWETKGVGSCPTHMLHE